MIRIMKTKTAIISALICIYGATPGHASECAGAGCDIAPSRTVIIEDIESIPAWDFADVPTVSIPARGPVAVEFAPTTTPAMQSAKLLSIKPVPADDRTALWDGTDGKYTPRTYDKTVDWRDGIPIWDDSISDYKYKDFSDWFLEPLPEIYLRDSDTVAIQTTDTINPVEMYRQNMADAAATRARVEELLTPKRPTGNLWGADTVSVTNESAPAMTPRPEYTAQDMTVIVEKTFGTGDGCPFETETECNIWRRKPIVRETVSPRSPKIRAENMAEFIAAAQCDANISASNPAAAPLLARYKMLMQSARACCTDGMAYALKQAGATDGLIYKFMADDANFYGLGARCLMTTDAELDAQYPNTATAVVAADVRNGCLCRGRQWFTAMLAPFRDAYAAAPEFADAKFNYTYTDGLQREITVSINNDVQNVLKQLEQCP